MESCGFLVDNYFFHCQPYTLILRKFNQEVALAENGIDQTVQEYSFTNEELAIVEKHKAKYPDVKSAVMPVLWMAQNKYQWLSSGAIQLVADTLGLSYAHVYGVATFYTMYYKKPVPKHVMDICTCFACGEIGGQEVYEHAKAYTKADPNGFSEDGLFYFRHAECLGACDTGPVAQVTNRHYLHNLTPERMEQHIEDLRAGKELTYQRIPLIDQSKL